MLQWFFKNKHRTCTNIYLVFTCDFSHSQYDMHSRYPFHTKPLYNIDMKSKVCLHHSILLTQKPGGLWARRFSVNGHKALGLNPDTQPETHNTPYSVFIFLIIFTSSNQMKNTSVHISTRSAPNCQQFQSSPLMSLKSLGCIVYLPR